MNSTELESSATTINTKEESVKKKCCGIYGLRNKIDGKWYIGLSENVSHRWETAYEKLNCKRQPKIYNALKKYGVAQFDKVVLEECSPEHLNEREAYWISQYDSIRNGYNLTAGGGRFAKHSDETKRKISNSKRGIKLTVEMKEKIRLGKLGKRFTTEHRRKISEALKGRVHSDEHNRKISESQLNRFLQ